MDEGTCWLDERLCRDMAAFRRGAEGLGSFEGARVVGACSVSWVCEVEDDLDEGGGSSLEAVWLGVSSLIVWGAPIRDGRAG